MPLYENVFVARQDMSSSQVEAVADIFAGIIGENSGEVAKKEFWGVRTLAYRIKNNRKGHYVLFNIDAPSAAIKEMERQMRLNEDVIRFLTVRVDELEEGPSAVVQSRSARDDRSRRGGGDFRRGGPPGQSRHAGDGKPAADAEPNRAATAESAGAESAGAESAGADKPETDKPATDKPATDKKDEV